MAAWLGLASWVVDGPRDRRGGGGPVAVRASAAHLEVVLLEERGAGASTRPLRRARGVSTVPVSRQNRPSWHTQEHAVFFHRSLLLRTRAQRHAGTPLHAYGCR